MRGLGGVLRRYPQANAAFAGSLRPRMAYHDAVDVKLTLDKRVGDVRSVLSVVLPDVDACTLDHLQNAVDRLRDTPVEDIRELDGVRALQKLPIPLGRLAFGLATRLGGRHRRLGTVALTSLGHQPVHRFFSFGGTTLTVGLGRIAPTPVAVHGQVVIASLLPLSLTFDHRVLDGALAAEVLAELKKSLENPDAYRVSPPAERAAVTPARLVAVDGTGSRPGGGRAPHRVVERAALGTHEPRRPE
jgi:hypothetical protein